MVAPLKNASNVATPSSSEENGSSDGEIYEDNERLACKKHRLELRNECGVDFVEENKESNKPTKRRTMRNTKKVCDQLHGVIQLTRQVKDLLKWVGLPDSDAGDDDDEEYKDDECDDEEYEDEDDYYWPYDDEKDHGHKASIQLDVLPIISGASTVKAPVSQKKTWMHQPRAQRRDPVPLN